MIAYFARTRFSMIELIGALLATDVWQTHGWGWGLTALIAVALLSIAADLKVRYG